MLAGSMFIMALLMISFRFVGFVSQFTYRIAPKLGVYGQCVRFADNKLDSAHQAMGVGFSSIPFCGW